MAATIGELCAGYGGLGMGVSRVIDAEVAWYSEIDKGALKVLEHRFHGIPNIGDMTAVDWATVPRVDILTGGTPCQDLSHAGKRAGMTEGTRSNLWVAMREAIAVLRPSLVIWENVGGAYSAEADSDLESDPRLLADTRRRDGEPVLRALGRVLGDLASLGYVGGWHGLRAADVGAPHGRLRVFVVAYPSRGRPAVESSSDGGRSPVDGPELGAGDRARVGDPSSRVPVVERGARQVPSIRALIPTLAQRALRESRLLPSPRTSDTNGVGAHGDGGLDLRTAVTLLPTPACNDMGAAYTPDTWDAWTAEMKAKHANGNGHGPSLNVESTAPNPRATNDTLCDTAHKQNWGDYADAIHRWETLTRPAPEPTMLSKKGTPQLSPAFSEWMMGLPAGWVTDAPGITRNEALRALGNGVCPQQCAAAVAFLLGVLGSEVAA